MYKRLLIILPLILLPITANAFSNCGLSRSFIWITYALLFNLTIPVFLFIFFLLIYLSDKKKFKQVLTKFIKAVILIILIFGVIFSLFYILRFAAQGVFENIFYFIMDLPAGMVLFNAYDYGVYIILGVVLSVLGWKFKWFTKRNLIIFIIVSIMFFILTSLFLTQIRNNELKELEESDICVYPHGGI